jgi:hypothetical protein
MVVKRDAAGVYHEVPHAVSVRFAINENGILVDSNDVPVVESFTKCCDSQRARFSQYTHLKQADGQLVLIAGATFPGTTNIMWVGQSRVGGSRSTS